MALPCPLGLLASRLPGLITCLSTCLPCCPSGSPKAGVRCYFSFFLVGFVFFILFFQLKKIYTLFKCCFPFAVKTSVVLSYFPDSLVSAPSIVHE